MLVHTPAAQVWGGPNKAHGPNALHELMSAWILHARAPKRVSMSGFWTPPLLMRVTQVPEKRTPRHCAAFPTRA
eukprot:315944-Chlamydomonas_euryale.AAC.1